MITARTVYSVQVTYIRGEGRWQLTFADWPEIDGYLDEGSMAETVAREQIAAMVGHPPGSFDVDVRFVDHQVGRTLGP